MNYSPVCHVATDTTYFSACHAGCNNWNSDDNTYDNCACLTDDFKAAPNYKVAEQLIQAYADPFTTEVPQAYADPFTTEVSQSNVPDVHFDLQAVPLLNDDYSAEFGDDLVSRSRRAVEDLVLRPGICMEGCSTAFWTFSITSMIVNWFGSSGRIGNVLVNYRAVSPEDKSFAQGLALMMISLFALIPGPIIFGRIIDSTCLVWTQTCNGTGNCQLHDQTKFRYSVNFLSVRKLRIFSYMLFILLNHLLRSFHSSHLHWHLL